MPRRPQYRLPLDYPDFLALVVGVAAPSAPHRLPVGFAGNGEGVDPRPADFLWGIGEYHLDPGMEGGGDEELPFLARWRIPFLLEGGDVTGVEPEFTGKGGLSQAGGEAVLADEVQGAIFQVAMVTMATMARMTM